jgi:YidC/Oxa1 family membrane protein insertase
MMERNLILAVVLSVVVVVGFQLLSETFSPQRQKSPGAKDPAVRERVTAKVPVEDRPNVTPAPAKDRHEESATPRPTVTAPAPSTKDEPEALFNVETPQYKAVLSTKGARIVSFKLKDFSAKLGDDVPVNLVEPGPFDCSGPSLMLTRKDETLNDTLLTFKCEGCAAQSEALAPGQKRSLTFSAVTAAGLRLEKTYTFHADKYPVDFSVSLTNQTDAETNYLVTFPWKKSYKGEKDERFAWNSVEILLDGMLKEYYFKDIKGDEEPSGKVQWVGLGDIYFFKALVFGENPASKVTLFKTPGAGLAEIWARYGAVDLPPHETAAIRLALYLGPKEHTALDEAGHDLNRALFYSNYWILEQMSRILMTFLRFCHSGFQVGGVKIPGTGNWGWDIIILTILIKLLFIPLTHKGMQSMKNMAALQPEMARLKEKHKDDKAALNKAMMELYKEHRINPLGGCWPMLLQLPVFLALYQVLAYAIELRHASFFCAPSIYLCIKDLSAPDPYYVTPVLMGVTMFLQNKLTPTPGDQSQRIMMMLMPVFLTYVCLNLPAGLVIYWIVNNVLSILQQGVTNILARKGA